MNVLAPPRAARAEQLVLRLDGFEGPLDLLLDLARSQRIDLHRISILSLVEQFLAVIEGARRIRLELAADWLVMAAWLAWLKSRLLLPSEDDAEEQVEDVERLAERLAGLEGVRALSAWLDARPVLGRDVHRRGAPESFVVTDRSGLRLDQSSLLAGYLHAVRRAAGLKTWRPDRRDFWTVAAALDRIERLLGRAPDWTALDAFLPPRPSEPAASRAALASTLIAALELARRGGCELSQSAPFGPVMLRPAAR